MIDFERYTLSPAICVKKLKKKILGIVTRQSFFQNGVTITTQLMILRLEKKSLYSSNFFQMLSLNIHIFVVVIFKH